MADIKCFVLCFIICLLNYTKSNSLLCEQGFCQNYMFDTGCSATSNYCRINNATHSGLSLPSPTICNCCDYCLPFYIKGAHCSVGGPGTGTTIGRCGDGLSCAEDPTDGETRCFRMTSDCHKLQDDYDERERRGKIGALEERPMCDGKGKHAPLSCVPAHTYYYCGADVTDRPLKSCVNSSTIHLKNNVNECEIDLLKCFCQSEEGERIFGEALYMGTSTVRHMECGCSRFHEKISNSITPGVAYPVTGPRCTSDGNFNPVQCIDRLCYCVDPTTGVIEDVDSIDLDEDPITELSCYNPNLDNFPQYSEGSPPYNYTTPCFEDLKEKIALVQQSEEDGYNVDFGGGYTECYPDGTYGRIAYTRRGSKICIDERGRQIGNYEAVSGTEAFNTMDCKCAVTSYLMGASSEKPVCCKNGNFRRIQCRRGLCRCVDSDGRQTETERTDVDSLHCFTEDWKSC